MKTLALRLPLFSGALRTPVAQLRLMGLGVLVVLSALLGVAFGGAPIPLELVGAALLDLLAPSLAPGMADSVQVYIIQSVRLPRVLGALVLGAALGVSGTVMQALFRNPLAEPTIIGVTGGAMVGAGLYIVLLGGLVSALHPLLAHWGLPLFAITGSIAFTVVVYRLSSHGGQTRTDVLILAGIALNALAGAVIGLLIFVADDQAVKSLTFWNLGSLAGVNWTVAGLFALGVGAPLVALLRYPQSLNLLLLGDTEAAHLGVQVQPLKRLLLLLCTIMIGVGVSFTGVIGFLGLVSPHLMRLLGGPNHRWLLPASALGGALLLVSADTAARVLAPPQELPIGVLTALLGVPFFLWLLLRYKQGR